MNNWYKKQLLSYFPIFLLTITVIVLLGLVVISDISRKETEKANRMSADYVADTMVRSLDDIENAVLKELNKNESIATFAEAPGLAGHDESLLLYNAAASLRSLIEGNPVIHSIYLYRAKDGLIIWPNGKTTLDSFGDMAFLRKVLEDERHTTDRWSETRWLQDRFVSSPARVISLVKQLPVPFGDKGVAVINADVRELRSYIGDIADTKISYLDVVDTAGQLVMSTDEEGENGREGGGVKQLAEIEVPDTAWTIRSGIKQGQFFGWFSLISYIWVAIGCAVIGLSLGYVIYISKRNYRPIQMMMNKLESIQLNSLPDDRKVDDLSFIGQALEDLIDQSRHYEEGRREHLITKRRQFFMDLVEGTGVVAETDWEETIPLPYRDDEGPADKGVIVAELGHEAFLGEGKPQDQAMLRLAVQSIVHDFLDNSSMRAWCEWISGGRLGVICRMEEGKSAKETLLPKVAACRQWVEENFGIRFVFAQGVPVASWEDLPVSYASATAALGYKLTGGETLIVAEERVGGSADDAHSYWVRIAEMAKAFRLVHGGWRDQLAGLFNDFRTHRLNDMQIHMILAALEKLLKKETGNEVLASETMRQAWIRLDVEAMVTESSSLDSLEANLTEALNEAYRAYVKVFETNSFQAVAVGMRTYIEEHFDDPDLSLKHLSDRFGMNGKNVSQLFKDAFGENFVDVLLRLRIEKAKRLLTETDLGQQDIAQQVGYSNAITFGRMFKRVVGVTPGDYRKKHV